MKLQTKLSRKPSSHLGFINVVPSCSRFHDWVTEWKSPDCRPSSDSLLLATALLEFLDQRVPPIAHCRASLRTSAVHRGGATDRLIWASECGGTRLGSSEKYNSETQAKFRWHFITYFIDSEWSVWRQTLLYPRDEIQQTQHLVILLNKIQHYVIEMFQDPHPHNTHYNAFYLNMVVNVESLYL